MSESVVQIPTRRDRQRVETRERLFRAACAEIDRVGLSEAQIPRIAKAAGVARATFYFHFPTKDDVLDELIGRLQTGLRDAIAEIDPQAKPLREVIGRLLETMLQQRAYVGDSNLMREMLAAFVRRARAEALPGEPELPTALAPHFAAAAARGEIGLPIDPERLSAMLLASMFGVLLGRHPNDDELGAALGLLIELFLRGIAA